MRKKSFLTILVLLMSISLISCAGKSTPKEESKTPKQSNETSKNETSKTQTNENNQGENKPEEPKAPKVNLIQYSELKPGEEIAVFDTTMGTIKLRLFPKEAPKTVENFKKLIEKKYYDGITFHRVIKDFMIQSGDPTATGAGGESIWNKPFEDEFSRDLHNFRGALSMANAGPMTNGSQFFIVQKKQVESSLIDQMKNLDGDAFPTEVIKKYEEVGGTPHLDYRHTVFGHVINGMDVVDKIASTKTGSKDKPLKEVKINKAYLEKYKK